eukprot:901448-Prorocentrum_minimum.AAC.1
MSILWVPEDRSRSIKNCRLAQLSCQQDHRSRVLILLVTLLPTGASRNHPTLSLRTPSKPPLDHILHHPSDPPPMCNRVLVPSLQTPPDPLRTPSGPPLSPHLQHDLQAVHPPLHVPERVVVQHPPATLVHDAPPRIPRALFVAAPQTNDQNRRCGHDQECGAQPSPAASAT